MECVPDPLRANGTDPLSENNPRCGICSDVTRDSQTATVRQTKCSDEHTAEAGHLEDDQAVARLKNKRHESDSDGSPFASMNNHIPKTYNGGYQVDMVGAGQEIRKCPICLQILRQPVQTTCGHLFCRDCIQPVLTGPNPTCPEDRLPLDGVFPDKHCERELNNLSVRCRNYAKCGWSGTLKLYGEKHEGKCPYETVPCPNIKAGCRQHVQRKDVERHAAEECNYQHVPCQYCEAMIPRVNMEVHHKNDCRKVIIKCPNHSCQERLQRQDLTAHLANDCRDVMIPCTLGCGMKVRRGDFPEHCVNPDAAARHLVHTQHQLTSVQQQLHERDSLVAQQQAQIDQLKEKLASNNSREIEDLRSDVRSLQQVAAQSPSVGADQGLRGRLSSVEQDLAAAKLTQSELKVTTSHQAAITQELTQQMDNTDLRVMELETTAYDGFLIWRIPHFSKLLADAQKGVKTSHYSQPFYAGRYGYKACARLYPNGDGAGYGKYVSLFFVLMAGQYDAILPWPFTRKVTLTLLDQSPARHHISETFSPDVRSSSFQRPTSGLNVASGCPCFVSHKVLQSTLHQYLRDDTLFVKIKMNVNSMEHM